MVKHIIDNEILNKFKDELKSDKVFNIIENAVQKNGIEDVIFSTKNSFKMQDLFNNEIEDLPMMTNQKKSGRCWMFSGLSILSLEIKKKLKIKELELSESYLMFYDKLEKCNTIFEYVIKNINEPYDSRLFRYILNLSGENDGNCWHSFVKLVKKYGICPKDVMGETYDSSNSDKMNQIISNIVTRNIYIMKNSNHSQDELYRIKENALKDVYKILSLCIGEPVKEFTFDYEMFKDKDKDKDKDKENKNDIINSNDSDKSCTVEAIDNNKNIGINISSKYLSTCENCFFDSESEDNEKNEKKNGSKSDEKEFNSIKITPLEFLKKYSNNDFDDYIQLCNYPGGKYELMKCYANELNISIIDDSSINYKLLNVDINVMKGAIIKSIQNNIPVWFACDVTMDSSRYDGYLSTEVIETSNILGIEIDYDKTAKIELCNTEANHAMVFVGVHLDDNGKPIRWKIQNSWGEDVGKKGYFIMTDSWFTKYVYECSVNKKFVTEDIIEAYKSDPIILKPWDCVA